MFRNSSRNRDTLLPHSGNGRGGGGGLYGSARMTPKASISKSFIATMVWGLASFALIYGGWTYCSRRMESTSVKCDLRSCQVLDLNSGITSVLTIPRGHMVRGEVVRLKNGQVVNPADLRRSAQRKLGHTYSLVYLEPDSEDDDDESYDSFEDDDDSYDSYDGDDDSSEDDDEIAVLPPGSRPSRASPNQIPSAGGPGGAKAAIPDAKAMEERRAAQEKRRAEQRAKWAEERKAKGLPPIVEPDKQKEEKLKASVMTGNTGRSKQSDEDEDRFPGDAGTLLEKNLEKNREQIRRLDAAQGMNAEGHRERSKRAYEEASKAHQAKHRMDSQMKQRGNNLHDRSAEAKAKTETNLSPDDPDNIPASRSNAGAPKLERQRAQKDLNAGGQEQMEGTETTEEIKMGKGGGRKTSSVGGLEEQDEEVVGAKAVQEERRRLSSQGGQDGADAVVEDNDNHNGFESLGDFVQAGATGARRKLLSYKNRVKNANPAPAKRSKVEIARDAAKAREAHRQGHGHHQKRAKKVAQPTEAEESSVPRKKTKHHHKAFHHRDNVPQADRHHTHHAYHHKPGQEKIEHGWRHQNRQWHGRGELRKVGTTYSLGRTTAKRRKEAIDSYVSRRTSEVNFTDSKKWRAGGLWMMIVGSISIAFCLVIGNFRPRPKTKKVS
ncbi:unnamed protein product [Scytosiphon promiscuus]